MPFEYVEQYAGMGFRVGSVSAVPCPPHFHNEYELLYSLSGTAKISLPHQTFHISNGSGMIIERNMIHSFSFVEPIEELNLLCLNIDAAFCTNFCPQFARMHIAQINASEAENPMFIYALHDFFELYFREAFHPQPQTYLRLMSAFTYLCSTMMTDLKSVEFGDQPAMSGKEDRALNRLIDILNYTLENHSQKITLSEIAERYNLDMYYLSHFIHKMIGVSFQEYLSRIRLDHAVRLMINEPKKSISEISYEAGFSDLRYCSKAFMKSFNCSPAEYRSKMLVRHADLRKDRHNIDFPFPDRPDYEPLAANILQMLARQREKQHRPASAPIDFSHNLDFFHNGNKTGI